MRIPRPILKGVAVCSSLLLAGGLIAYRSGAFPWLKAEPPDIPHMSGSKSIRMEGLTPATGTALDPAFLAGSKSYSGVVTISPGTLNPTPQPDATARPPGP